MIFRHSENKIGNFLLVMMLLAAFVLRGMSVNAAPPTGVVTTAQNFVIYDATDGKVIAGKNEEAMSYPASLTKIMTALLVCENISDLDRTVTFTDVALSEMTADSSRLSPAALTGETMTVKDALYGMFLVSANDCAAQLGVEVAGSREAFAALMNERAKQIGCTNTSFVNAIGLHDAGHYTTASDMAKIFAEALKNKKFFELATTYNYTIGTTNMCGTAREMVPTHKILNGQIYYPEVFAGKTGSTPEAGKCLATAARFGGHTVIIILLKSNVDELYNDAQRLLEYARGFYDGLYTDMTWTPVDDTMYVNGTNSLLVRDYPSAVGTTIVDRLTYGAEVHRKGVWGDWSCIELYENDVFVYNAFLSSEKPVGEFDPESAIKTPTRPSIIVHYEDTVETDEDTPETKAQGYTGSINIDDLLNDETGTGSDQTPGVKKGNIQNGLVMTIMIIAIVLMVVIGIAFAWVEISEKKQRERRRAARAEKKRQEEAQAEKRKRYKRNFEDGEKR